MVQKVFVGLSGGVDSGTSAALLKERGYDVTGVFIKIWQPEFIECTWREDRLDAMRIAASLGIPFREIDLSDEYKREVVETMVHDYERGVTPNPDVLCNEKIKFGHFARWAFENGADFVATGHYARTETADDETRLVRGRDSAKDQTYFLYRIDADTLTYTLFPIGEYEKSHVRTLARQHGLPVAAKPDSQGLCFVGDVSMSDFLARYISLKRGAVLDTSGATIGEHDGAALYTIGQRHGFRLRTATPAPLYVHATDIGANTVTVSLDKTSAATKSAILADMHWIGDPQGLPFTCTAQSRYREKPFAITVTKDGDAYTAAFDAPHVVSSGQSLVLYDGDTCLGGGVIMR